MIVHIPDAHVSSSHAKVERLLGRWVLVDLGSKNGTLVGGEPTRHHALVDGDLIEIGRTILTFRDGVPQVRARPAPQRDRGPSADTTPELGLRTLWPPLEHDFALLGDLARSRVSIVLRGETGTGKEVVTRAIHAMSGRRGPLVPVNCGALPPTLIESTLFGHKKGAFSGATEDQPGLVRASDGGTLFLDEIGDLPLASQTALLRVLQESEVTAVGASRPVTLDLRVVAATHHDLERMVNEGRFRADLWGRLSGHVHVIPPLRERREDLGLLIKNILDRMVAETPFAGEVAFELDAARAMVRYHWPRNVRELHKTIATAVVLAFASSSPTIRLEHLPPAIARPPSRAHPSPLTDHGVEDSDTPPPHPLTKEELHHREELIALLREHQGNLSAIARVSGKGRTQVQRWMKRYALSAEDFR